MFAIASFARWISVVVATWLALACADRAYAQVLTNRAFDIVLAGDDPGETFTFNLPGNAVLPSLVRFDGFFENLDPFETGVRHWLWWSLPNVDGGFQGIDFTRLPGSGRLPVQFTRWIWFTPETMVLLVEGGGPGDYFRFVGDLRIQQFALSSIVNCMPPRGIVAWWPGDLVTNDVIGAWPAMLRGGAGFGPGLVREAFSLNGDQQFVEVPDYPGLNLGNSDFTFELWVRFNTLNGEQVIAEKFLETMTAYNQGWTLTKLPNNTLRFALAGGRNVDSSPAGTLGSGGWTHIAVRRSGNTFTIFQNGSPTASGDFAVNLDSTSSLKFGHRGNPSDTPGSMDTRDFWLNGAIDEPTLYNRALSDQEIASIFQQSAAGKCRSPIVLALTPPSQGSARVTVKGIPSLPHVLQGSTDLINWSPLVTNVPTTEIFELEAVDDRIAHRFYRAIELH